MSDPGTSPRVECGLGGMKLGFDAQCGQVQPEDVEAVRAKCEQMLNRADPIFLAVTRFATRYMLARGEGEGAIARAGQDLISELQGVPEDFAWQGRADING